MIERRVTIGSRSGLHARPAALFVRKVNQLQFEVCIAKDGGEPVDARSIMLVLSQNIGSGDAVVLSTESDADGVEASLDELSAFLSTDLDAVDHE